MKKEQKEKIVTFATEQLGNEVAAGIDHFKRDYNIAQVLAKKEGLKFNDKILFAATFLHDVSEDEPHWIGAAKIAGKFLKTINFSDVEIKEVQQAILEHTPNGKPKSVESKLLHDADLIDFLGATGIARLSIGAWDWMEKKSLQEFLEVFKKFRKIASEGLVLKASKELAKDKIKFMDLAIKQLEKELKI
jgi:uncharacterized protein